VSALGVPSSGCVCSKARVRATRASTREAVRISSSAMRARVASYAARAGRAHSSRFFVLSGKRRFDDVLGAAHHFGVRDGAMALNVAHGGEGLLDILLHRVEAISQYKPEQRLGRTACQCGQAFEPLLIDPGKREGFSLGRCVHVGRADEWRTM